LVNQLLNPEEEVAVTTAPEKEDIKMEQNVVQTETTLPPKQPAVEQPEVAQQPQQIGGTIAPDSTIQTASFSNFEPVELNEHSQRNLDMLLDIPLSVTVELGRTKQTVEEILDLTQGSIIELDKLAGEPVDVLVNNKLIAKGEVVVIDENFGVRVTDIVSPRDRLMKLN